MIDIGDAELWCPEGVNSLLPLGENNDFLIEVWVNEHQPEDTIINVKLVETFRFS